MPGTMPARTMPARPLQTGVAGAAVLEPDHCDHRARRQKIERTAELRQFAHCIFGARLSAGYATLIMREVFVERIVADFAELECDGASDVPGFLQKFWPNGHPDRLRDAAGGWTMAAQSLDNLTAGLSQAVVAITDNNRTDCVAAMSEFWDSLAGRDGLFGRLVATCHQLAGACNDYAQAIDDAHDRLKTALAEAGIAVGLTTLAGILLTPFTFGASDEAAAAADAAEVEAIAAPIVEEFEATVAAEAETALGADVATALDSAAAEAPTVDAVEAETTEVQSAVDAELGAEEAAAPEAVTEPPQPVTKFEADRFGNAERATSHFENHAQDFGYQTEEEYVNGASNFLREAEENGYPARVDSSGNVRVYDPGTNRFAVYDSNNGVIRSFYKPSSPTYWERNSPDWGNPVQWN